MSEPKLSAYVKRCQDAYTEYLRLRALDVSHREARKMSGFEDAVMGKPVNQVEQLRDVRKIVAGDTE